MKIQTLTNNNSFHISLNGQLNSDSAPELESVLSDIPENINEITFDLKNLTYISSAGLRVIIIAGKRVGDGNLYISNMNDDVKDILKMTGIIDIVQVRKGVATVNKNEFWNDWSITRKNEHIF